MPLGAAVRRCDHGQMFDAFQQCNGVFYCLAISLMKSVASQTGISIEGDQLLPGRILRKLYIALKPSRGGLCKALEDHCVLLQLVIHIGIPIGYISEHVALTICPKGVARPCAVLFVIVDFGPRGAILTTIWQVMS